MSGIAGMLYPDVFQINHLVSPMLETLDHRGKGIRDVYTYRNVQLGCCGNKLSSNLKKNIYCAFDGALANRGFLIKEMRHLSIELPEQPSDGELVVAAYEAFGDSFPQYLNGNFAIAIFDQIEGKLFLARDRIGVKPLYWFHHQNHFIFASELKSILYTGSVPLSLSPDALSAYLYFGYFPQDMTPIKGINKLLPGYKLVYSLEESMNIEPYWSLSAFFQNPHSEKPEQLYEQLDHLIQTAVKTRIPDENPVGCFVSGGLGSASVAYYLQKLSPNLTESFSGGFAGYNDADLDAAKEIAETLSMPQKSIVLPPEELVRNLSKIVWYLDEPIADPNAITAWHLAENASKSVRTVFSGMGSDEFLAGHSRYTSAEREISPIKACFQSLIKKSKPYLLPILHYLWEPLALKLLKEARTDPWQLAHLQKYSVFDLKSLREAAPGLSELFDPQVFIHKFHHLSRIPSKVGELLYLDIKTRLSDCYCLQYERSSSAHGLVWQTPYLDRDLMEFAAGLPEPDALTEFQTAGLLKELLKDTYSLKLLNRPKRTRSHFLDDWSLHPPILELFHRLAHGTLVETGFISEKWIRRYIRDIPARTSNFKHLWSLLILEVWIQLFINRRIDSRPPSQSALQLIGRTHLFHD